MWLFIGSVLSEINCTVEITAKNDMVLTVVPEFRLYFCKKPRSVRALVGSININKTQY